MEAKVIVRTRDEILKGKKCVISEKDIGIAREYFKNKAFPDETGVYVCHDGKTISEKEMSNRCCSRRAQLVAILTVGFPVYVSRMAVGK
jgi:hypothetical protein